jgi:hypothetical protein
VDLVVPCLPSHPQSHSQNPLRLTTFRPTVMAIN